MPDPAQKKATYEDLRRLPDLVVGEIVGGELVATPRPGFRHSSVATGLGAKLGNPFRFGEGGPGGWVILFEPEVQLGADLLVPDLAGWRKERLPSLPETNWTEVVPDWVCEILSPGTIRLDRVRKMPRYAEAGVPHLWLIDPAAKTLESFRLEAGRWSLLSAFVENDLVRAEPFEAVELDLGLLWE